MSVETGRRALFILFLYRIAFDYCDTECQIKRPHARGSMSDLSQKQHYASFFLFICAALSSAAAASLLHMDGFWFSRRTFRKFFSFFRHGSRIRVIARRLASAQASVTTLAQANFSKRKTTVLSKNLQLLQFLMKTMLHVPCNVRRHVYHSHCLPDPIFSVSYPLSIF